MQGDQSNSAPAGGKDVLGGLSGPRPHEFFLIRYVPDVVRGEFINIGVVVRECRNPDRLGPLQARVHVNPDYGRIYGMFPDADLSYLPGLQKAFEEWLNDVDVEGEELISSFDKVTEQLSLIIQLTDPQGCLAEDIDEELTLLMRMYVDPEPGKALGNPKTTVNEAFQVLSTKETSHTSAERYTGSGDTLEFDYVYRTDAGTHILHAICIDDGIEPALGLAKRAESLRRGVQQIEGTLLEITVITEVPPEPVEGESGAFETYQFAVAVMREAGINVRTVADIPALAVEIKSTAL